MAETRKSIEDILDVNRKWLPPSPHAEAVLKTIKSGTAHIEQRGHDTAPLGVFEDGGVIELPAIRYEQTYRGMALVSAGESTPADQTRHTDVCGSVDGLQGLLKDAPELVASRPERLYQLLNDACYMIGRMQKRLDAYVQFVADIASLCPSGGDAPQR